ncbi:uncharacterized protein LOC126991705 [Eriocheir sinensis]|uniref:uncharacterized protein LOC126991705 n=1 Tax=Eriocheir sinensis TaxID=95602 RepID=UPI0021C7D52C|nr:uncharacterized protein LOC126991705 [Eriocheir sinensis]
MVAEGGIWSIDKAAGGVEDEARPPANTQHGGAGTQQEAKILGVIYDSTLTFRPHTEQLARTAAGKLASLRRISRLLGQRGRELLYKVQIRSSLEHSCLVLGGGGQPPRTLKHSTRCSDHPAGSTDVSGRSSTPPGRGGLTTLYKVQEGRVSHLLQLRLPPRRAEVHTRAVRAAPSALATPRSHTSHHQRQFQQA